MKVHSYKENKCHPTSSVSLSAPASLCKKFLIPCHLTSYHYDIQTHFKSCYRVSQKINHKTQKNYIIKCTIKQY